MINYIFFLKAAFRALVGKGYQTLRSLLLDFCQWQPSELLLSALLDMLVDGDFDLKVNYVIKVTFLCFLYFFLGRGEWWVLDRPLLRGCCIAWMSPSELIQVTWWELQWIKTDRYRLLCTLIFLLIFFLMHFSSFWIRMKMLSCFISVFFKRFVIHELARALSPVLWSLV